MNNEDTVHRVDAGGRVLRADMLPGASPTVVFCCGFRSDRSGTKAMTLDAWCGQRGQGYLRYDYSGHGESDGAFEDGTIGQWLADTLAVIDNLTTGPLLLVGSSMGGWIMLLTALARPHRICGLVGIASATDFTQDLLWNDLSDIQRNALERDGRIELPSDYSDDPHVITRELISEGRNHLLLDKPIALHCPVRLLHSLDDPDVPWETSLRTMQRIDNDNVRLILFKDAGHRMSRPEDLHQILLAVGNLLDELESGDPGTSRI